MLLSKKLVVCNFVESLQAYPYCEPPIAFDERFNIFRSQSVAESSALWEVAAQDVWSSLAKNDST